MSSRSIQHNKSHHQVAPVRVKGADHAVIARVSKAWNKLRPTELKPVLCAKGISLKMTGRVYETRARSCMMYGSKTWGLTAVTERKLERKEMRMVRLMCVVRLRDKFTNADLRNRLGIMTVSDAMKIDCFDLDMWSENQMRIG